MRKKMLSLALALAMCLGLTVPAFAASANSYSVNGYTDPTAENVEFSVAPIGVATIRCVSSDLWVSSPTREYTAYVFDQDCTVTRKDGLPLTTVTVQALDDGYVGASINSPQWWPYDSVERSKFAGLSADDDSGYAFSFAPDYTNLSECDWSPYMISKKGLDSAFPYEDDLGTGIVVEYRPLSAQPTGDPQVSGWAKEQVNRATENGLVPDGLGNDYRVNITRAQFAATAVKLYEAMSGQKAPAAGDSPFIDTSAPVIIQANALGIVNGKGNGKFAPDDLVTRQEASLMLSRVYTKLGGSIPEVTATTFADNGKVSGWARDAVAFMADKGIVNGVGNNSFDPLGNASIEQALVIALRMFDNLK